MTALDTVTARWDAARSALVAYLQPQAYGRRVTLMTVQGPARSVLEVFRGYLPELPGRFIRLAPADSRTWSADATSSPMVIGANQAAVFVWSAGATTSTSSATATLESEII